MLYIFMSMKAFVVYKNSKIPIKNHKFINLFIRFLNKKLPLENDIRIIFTGERIGGMTTGSRNGYSELKILTKKRINRDILRTLAHEWIHEYQKTILKRPDGPDIGGVNEDQANAISGQLIKMFEKKYPNFENKMYE